MNRRKIDKEFYESLDNRIKELIPFRDFKKLERKNIFSCKYYKKLIEKISEIENAENECFFDKTLIFIRILDLDIEKIGEIFKNCYFKKYLKNC